MSYSDNPFASPVAVIEPVYTSIALDNEAEAIRRKYLKHEASLKSIGSLYYLGAGLMTLAVVFVVIVFFADRDFGFAETLIAAIYAALAVGSFVGGRGLKQLDPKVKPLVGIFSAMGLFFFPLGTLINGYALYLVFGAKGKVVLSPGYQEVVRQTPHIKYKTSMIVIVLVIILLSLMTVGLFSALMFG